MERSSFFNAIIDQNGIPDRPYLAEDFARYFSTFIGNGVFPNPATNLQVVAVDDNMQIRIKAGFAWINGYMYENTDDYIFKLYPADGVLNRIDRVVLRLDFLERKIKAVVKKGEYGSSPKTPNLQRDSDAYEIAIADVLVRNGLITVTQANVTDLRLNKELCGIVHGVVDQVDPTAIFNQFQTWYSETKEAYNKDISKWTKDKKEAFDKWYSENTKDFLNKLNTWYESNTTNWENEFSTWFKNTETWESEFNNWFNNIKTVLDGDIAAKLTLKVVELEKEKIDKSEFNNFKKSTETQLADIVIDNKRLTNSKDITGAINELFINANNGKQNWVDVIGSPLNIEDTFSTLKNKTQNLKNSMAEKLTTKGQDSKGIEDLQVLINKIDMLNSYDIDMLFLKYGNIFNNLTSTNTSFLGINLKSKRIISKHTIEEKFNILDFQGNVLQTFIIPQEIGVPVYYDPRNDLLLCQLNYNYNDRITIIDINNNIVSKYVFASRYETAIMYFIDSDKYIYIVTRLHDNVQGYPELRLYKLKSDGTQIATLRIDNSIDTGRIDKDNSYIKERENDIIARVMWLYSDGCIILKTNKELNRYNKVHIPGNLNINIVAETLLI